MSQKTQIEWTNATWNPVTGCTKVSPGCDHCYADRLTERFRRGPFSEVKLHNNRLDEPRRWRQPQMVFTCSMGDLFHPEVPWNFALQVFTVMAATPWHTYQLLTKRPGRMAYFADHALASTGLKWPGNVWAGTSIENQKYAPRIDLLARVPATVRFVSVEPLLEPLDLQAWLEARTIQWVIVGGESGPGARPVEIRWVQSILCQCKRASIPIFVKQLGTAWASNCRANGSCVDRKGGLMSEWPRTLRVREYPCSLSRTDIAVAANE